MPINFYPRGFLYSQDAPVITDELKGFRHHQTSRGEFWRAPETELEILDRGTALIVLIGHAQYVSDSASTGDTREICAQIFDAWETAGRTEVEKYLYDLGGRYALFVLTDDEQYVYHDAHGMRSVYFIDGQAVVSSHERMLADLVNAQPELATISSLPLALRGRFSRFHGITALQPNHRLDLLTTSQSRYFPYAENSYLGASDKERLDLAQHLWTEQIRLITSDRDVALSMTGGIDSRVSLAMSRAFWDRIKAFTYTAIPRQDSAWSRSIYQDEAIVQQILDVVNIDHEFLRRDEAPALSASEKNTLAKNTAGQHGQWLLKLYQQRFPNPSTVHLRANLHETGRNYFHKYRTPAEPLRGLRKLLRDQTVQRHPAMEAQIDAVMGEFDELIGQAGYRELPTSYEPLDMYYWELRQGRWFSEVFNETDCAFETAIPFNHRRLIDLALSFDARQRREGYFFKELINRSAPFLNFFGVNSTQNLYEQGRDKQKESSPSRIEKLNNPSVLGVAVSSKISILNECGKEISHKPYAGSLYVPAEHFRAGHVAEIQIDYKPDAGSYPIDLQLSVENTYENSRATSHMEFVVEVDGAETLSHDLSTRPEPFGITMTALPAGTCVKIRIRALRDTPRDSWEKASRTGLQIVARVAQGQERKILTDNPFAKILPVEPAN